MCDKFLNTWQIDLYKWRNCGVAILLSVKMREQETVSVYAGSVQCVITGFVQAHTCS